MDPALFLLLTVGAPWGRKPPPEPAPEPAPAAEGPEEAPAPEPEAPPEPPPPPAPGLFVHERPVDLGPLPPGLANVSAQACAACHVSVHDEWAGSGHHGGWLDPLFLDGTRAAPEAPHPVAVSSELGTSAFCGTCHQLAWPGADQPFYDTYGEWERSAWAYAGVQCQDCHMPPTAGVATAGRFADHASHTVAVDPARAVSVLVGLPGSALTRGESLAATVRVQNSGAGHAFPTGTPFAHVLLVAELLDSEGERVGEPLAHRLRRQVTPEPPYTTVEDTRLPAGGEVLLDHAVELSQKAAAGIGAYRVTLARVRSDGTVEEPFVTHSVPVLLD